MSMNPKMDVNPYSLYGVVGLVHTLVAIFANNFNYDTDKTYTVPKQVVSHKLQYRLLVI